MIKRILFSLMLLLTISITLAQSSDFNTTYTRLIEGVFSEGTGIVNTGAMVESGILNLSVKGQFPEMKGGLNISMNVPYTTYTNTTKKHQSYSKITINANIEGSLEEITIPNTPIKIEVETIILSHYMYYNIKRLDFDLSKWNTTNEDLQYIKEFLLSDGKKVYMNRWIRVRVPQESQEILEGGYNTLNIQAIKDLLIKNPIFKQIGITNKGYIITFDETNLQKVLPTEFADRLHEIQQRKEDITNEIQLANSGILLNDSEIVITGLMTTGVIPSVEFLLSEENNMIQMNINEENISLKSNININDDIFKANFNITSIGDQSYKLGLSINYSNITNKNNLDFLMENTTSYLFLDKNVKIRTPIRAKSIEQIMSEVL